MRPSLLIMLVWWSIVFWCSYWPGNVFGHHHSSTYDERAWRRAGQFLNQYSDQSIKPCEDFFEHVCGKFHQQVITDDDNNGPTIRHSFLDQKEAIGKTMLKLIDKMIEEEERESDKSENNRTIEQHVLRFYHQCSSRQEGGNFERGDMWQNFYALSNATVNELLLPAVSAGGKNETGHRWRLLGRMWRVLGASTLPIDREHAGYELQIVPDENATVFVLNPLLPSTRIGPEQVDDFTTYHDGSFEQLLRLLVPNIEWRAFFDEVLGAGTSRTWLDQPEESAKFAVSGVRTLNEMGSLINEMDDVQFDTVIAEGVRLHLESILIGEADGIEEMCVNNLINRQPAAIAGLYLRSIGSSPSAWSRDMETMRRNLFSAFRFLLSGVDWLDEADKEKVHSKLDEMRFFPGIPDWAEDTDKVIQSMQLYAYDDDESTTSPFSAEIGWIKSDQYRKLRRVLTRKDDDEQRDDTVDFNPGAFYDSIQNKIKMVLGLLLPPFYDVNYPMAVKYGGIGSAMGHELMHAFDANNLERPSAAYEHDWISERAMEEFEQRKSCLIKQYSSFCIEDEAYCVSGAANIGENMADVDGVKVAYTAFKFAKQVLGADPPVPAMLLNYTSDDQLFFLTHARMWCSRGWRDAWLVDPHSPEKARIDVSMANNPIFARAFKCQVGSKYAPLKTCTMWGSLAEPAARKRRRRRRRSDRPYNL